MNPVETMINRSLSFLISLLLTFSANAQTDSLTKVVEATYRAGLSNFFHKIQNRQNVKVAYLGDSITRADQGWRDQTVDWLKDQYPQEHIGTPESPLNAPTLNPMKKSTPVSLSVTGEVP